MMSAGTFCCLSSFPIFKPHGFAAGLVCTDGVMRHHVLSHRALHRISLGRRNSLR